LLDGRVHRVHVGVGEEYFDDLLDDILEAVEAPPAEDTLVEPDVEVEIDAEGDAAELEVDEAEDASQEQADTGTTTAPDTSN
jgi:hypothetical protein